MWDTTDMLKQTFFNNFEYIFKFIPKFPIYITPRINLKETHNSDFCVTLQNKALHNQILQFPK